MFTAFYRVMYGDVRGTVLVSLQPAGLILQWSHWGRAESLLQPAAASCSRAPEHDAGFEAAGTRADTRKCGEALLYDTRQARPAEWAGAESRAGAAGAGAGS